MSYRAPVADMRFALEACADLWSLRSRFPDIDPELLEAILDGAGSLAGSYASAAAARSDAGLLAASMRMAIWPFASQT